MIALLSVFLGILASSFKSKSRIEAENAVLRQQLIVLQRKLRGRARLSETPANAVTISLPRSFAPMNAI